MALVPLTEDLIQSSISRAVQHVFHTVMRHDATLVSRTALPVPHQVIVSVGFVGEVNGVVCLCLTDEFARFATTQVLGLGPGDAENNDPEVVKDVLGEVANMTVGNFKNLLCDVGYPCRLTLPTLARGNGLRVVTVSGATCYVFEYNCAGHTLTADIKLRPG